MSHDETGLRIRKATLRLGEQRLANFHGDFDVHFFRDLAQEATAMAISIGDLGRSAPLLARVHSSCVTSECLMGCDCDCSEQLEGALETMALEGRGIVYYLMQEGRGAGLTAKARDRMIVQASGNRVTTFEAYASMGLPADVRSYDVVAPMSRMLGIHAPIKLLTNNPDKSAAVAKALEGEKIEVLGTESIQGPTSPFNRDYLTAKHDSGHALDRPSRLAGALPPVPVEVFEPAPLPGDPQRVVTASYFLPVALPVTAPTRARDAIGGGDVVEWFRLSVVYDRSTERESILLSHSGEQHGLESSVDELHEPVTMRLFDRLPGSGSTGRAALRESLIEIRERGRGAVVVRFDDRDHAEP
jgi:GTP cyclohydrolase II